MRKTLQRNATDAAACHRPQTRIFLPRRTFSFLISQTDFLDVHFWLLSQRTISFNIDKILKFEEDIYDDKCGVRRVLLLRLQLEQQ